VGPTYRLWAGGERIFADFVVGADGVRSVVRRFFLGPLPKRRSLPAICRFYEKRPGDPIMIRVTPFPGYVWAFGRPDCLVVGVGAMEHGHSLGPELDRFMAEFFPGRKPLGPATGALLPRMYGAGAYRERRTGSGWALVGDAAGFCDTLTGEGILYAAWSADLLAEAYLAGNPAAYDRAWRRAFGAHLALGARMARVFSSHRNIDRFFTAITACPSFRKVLMDFVWNLPSYPRLALQLIATAPRTLMEWRRFVKAGGRIDPSALGAFEAFADRLTLHWD